MKYAIKTTKDAQLVKADSEGNINEKTLIAGGGNQGFYRMMSQPLAVDELDSVIVLAGATSCGDFL